KMKLFGMRQPAVVEPELLIEALKVGNKSVSLPTRNGSAVIQWIIRIAAYLPHLLARVRVHDPLIAVAATYQDENPVVIPVFKELHSVRLLKLPGAAGRLATLEHGIAG